MKRETIGKIISFFLPFLFIAQSEKVDSLLSVLKTSQEDTNKVNILNQLSKIAGWEIGDYEKSMFYAKHAFTLSQKLMFNSGIATSLNNIGIIHDDQGNYIEALKNHFGALKIEEAAGDKKGTAISYNNIGIVYYSQRNYLEALKNHFASLRIKKELGDKKGIAYSYINIGLIYNDQGKLLEALNYYNLSLKLREEIKDKSGVSACLNNIGIIYGKLGKYSEALKCHFTSLKIKEELEDKMGIASSYTNIGDIYAKTGKNQEAKVWLQNGLTLAKELGLKEIIKECYGGISSVENELGNYKEAYINFKMYISYYDSLINEEKSRSSLQIQIQYEFDKKQAVLKEQQLKEMAVANEKNRKQKIITYFIIGCLLLVVAFSVFILRTLRLTRKQKVIIETKEKETQHQKHLIEEKQKEIVDSINYAKRIQYTLLAHEEFLKTNLNEHFTFFNPKDIVSGDFYWATSISSVATKNSTVNNLFYLAVCDSTGHGVPGAFMSLLNIGFLNEAINEKGITLPSEIFDYVRQKLTDTISKEGQKDGFDGILLCVDKSNHNITYAAANNAPILIKQNKGASAGSVPTQQLIELDSDRMPVGVGERKEKFKLYTIEANSGDMLYLYTDGYADQFGGPKGKKFKYKQLNEVLLANHHLPMKEQCERLKTTFSNWKGELEQVDDVCVIGIRI